MSHPDMCCICFERIEPGQHAEHEGQLWDVCLRCADVAWRQVSDSNGVSGE